MSLKRYLDELIENIKRLKIKRKAIILAHNYQLPEVQDIADYVGDSLGLSLTAGSTDAKVILFCGVRFMAETASILCSDKIVLLPDINAVCPMADMITADRLRELKKNNPEASVLSYINSSAEVKAESDVCCTSGNAVMLAHSLKDSRRIIFISDKYLANYVALKTNCNFITWDGYCPTHVKILAEDILIKRKSHPRAEVWVHPECRPEVISLADRVLSTGGMCKYAKETDSQEIIVGTEIGILHRLQKENPEKKFYPASEIAICPNMKLTTLDKILWALEDMRYKIDVPETVKFKAKRSVKRMLQLI